MIQHSYTAPGEEHQIVDIDKFYEIEVNGVRLVDRVDATSESRRRNPAPGPAAPRRGDRFAVIVRARC